MVNFLHYFIRAEFLTQTGNRVQQEGPLNLTENLEKVILGKVRWRLAEIVL